MSRRYLRTVLFAAPLVAVVLVASGAAGNGGGRANPPTTAHLYVSPDGADAGACTKKVPCLSFARAFAVAPAGALVSVAAGEYGSSCAPVTGSKSRFVTFVGAAGSRVVCTLQFDRANHIEFRGITLYQLVTRSSSYLRFTRLALTCRDHAPYALYPPGNLCDAHISLNDSSQLEFTKVSIGPTYDSSACGGAQTNVAFAVAGVRFTSVTFKDARYQAAPCGGADGSDNQHSENFYFSGLGTPARDVTFESCRFTNGPASGKVVNGVADGTGPDSAGLFLTGVFDGLTIRNCVFDGPGGAAIDGAVDARITNSLIQNNTWTRPAIFQYESYPSLSFTNNLGAQQSCPVAANLGSSGGIFSHNLWYFPDTGGSADRCGSTDVTANGPGIENSIFANADGQDYRLKPGSPAIGRGDPASYAHRDRAGLIRPQGKLPDIGAYELPVAPKPKPKPKVKPKPIRSRG